eukprot:scaffold702_cov350-Pinguiococcus_pyrenoidosus.AAC.2
METPREPWDSTRTPTQRAALSQRTGAGRRERGSGMKSEARRAKWTSLRLWRRFRRCDWAESAIQDSGFSSSPQTDTSMNTDVRCGLRGSKLAYGVVFVVKRWSKQQTARTGSIQFPTSDAPDVVLFLMPAELCQPHLLFFARSEHRCKRTPARFASESFLAACSATPLIPVLGKMFRFIALAALAAPALAFKGVSPLRARSSALFATEENPLPETTPAAVVPEEVKEVVGEVKEAVEAVAEKVPLPEPEAPKGPRKAQWLPFGLVDAPEMLDGTLAGDVGFDPLGFADSEAQLIWMREAEVKHCRLAMLAAIGWPMAEKVHGGLATTFGLDYLLSDGGKAPSVLNGGLGNLIIAVGLGFAAVLASAIEVNSLSNGTQKRWEEEKADNYNTGELGFDPLGELSRFPLLWARAMPLSAEDRTRERRF